MRPVWDALPDDVRGTWFGRFGERMGSTDPTPDRPILIAGFADHQKIPHRRPIVLEHGAGQAYPGDPLAAKSGSFAGGDGWDNAIGFLSPSSTVADRWRARYPDAVVDVVGCPKLDHWHGVEQVRTVRPIVAFSFHWDCPLIPETRSALAHHYPHLPGVIATLRALGYQVAGHAHPRWRGSLDRRWVQWGVPIVRELDDVMATASVFVADNTSALYEFAALDRPVVVLNAPWYRRDIDHGLRFWSLIPGVLVDDGAHLTEAITAAADGLDGQREHRRAVVSQVYASLDGTSSQQAASAIVRMLDR